MVIFLPLFQIDLSLSLKKNNPCVIYHIADIFDIIRYTRIVGIISFKAGMCAFCGAHLIWQRVRQCCVEFTQEINKS